MKKIWTGVQVVAALGYTGLVLFLWVKMALDGDDSWLSWRRSFDVAGLFVDMYALLLCSAVSVPAMVFGLWRVAQIFGLATDREGPRWTAQVLIVMAILGLSVVVVRWQLWENLVGGSARAGKPQPPSDEKLEYPALPLAPEEAFKWEIQDLGGKTVDFASFKGKAVFMNIWATWCGFCVLELPNVKNLYAKFKDDPNVAFVIISDEKPEKVKAWLDSDAGKDFKDLPIYLTPVDYPQKYAPGGYPTTHILAPDGRTAFTHSGFVAWDGEKTVNFLKQLAHGAGA